GVAYRVYGGLRFFERQEVKHALAYLRLIANPDDDTAFMRVVNFPTRGIGARSLEILQDAARTFNTPLYQTVPHLSGKPGAALGHFVGLIERLRTETAPLPLHEIIEHVIEMSGLRAHYTAEKEGQERLENLDELINAAVNFNAEAGAAYETEEGAGDGSALAGFLAHASLEAGDHQADAGTEAVQLMTVHAAKGLEFDVVFLSGLEEGLFPHENSILESDGLEEERRLMYVAMTRARQRLYISFTQSRMLHGQVRYNLRSRFLEEIPEALTKWLTPPNPRRSFVSEPSPRYYNPGASKPAGLGMPPPPPMKSRDLGGLAIGSAVSHARFGEGVIVAAEGSGSDARVQVKFASAGTKWLMLAVAKLTPC
ncbi:MAG TPA: 3'-5' exonuclease, partial [Zoogloea sp.]|nr:3'-5' exonuclease [Zoogloea sp.]